MTRDREALNRHPAPEAERLSSWGALALLFTGPLAWFVQLCVAVWATSWPCYPDENHLASPLPGYGWAHPMALVVLAVCTLVAAVTAGLAWRKFREVEHEHDSSRAHLLEVGHGRTRFVALLGTIFNAGAALAMLANLVGFALVPPCLG